MTALQQRLRDYHQAWLLRRDQQHSIGADEQLFDGRLRHFCMIAFIQGAIGQQLLVQLTQLPMHDLIIIPITPADVKFVERIRAKLHAHSRRFFVQFDVGHIHQLSMQIASVDLAIMAASRPFPEFAEALNGALIRTGTHGLFAHLHGINFSLGPLVVPGHGACYACYQQRLRVNSPHPDVDLALDQYFRSDFEFDWEGQHPTINMMAAGLVVAEVLRFATGHFAPNTLSTELYAKLLTEQPYTHHLIAPTESCSECAQLRQRLMPASSYTLQSVMENYARP